MSAGDSEHTTEKLCADVLAALANHHRATEKIVRVLEGAAECKNMTDSAFLDALRRFDQGLSSIETRLAAIDQKLAAVLRPREVER